MYYVWKYGSTFLYWFIYLNVLSTEIWNHQYNNIQSGLFQRPKWRLLTGTAEQSCRRHHLTCSFNRCVSKLSIHQHMIHQHISDWGQWSNWGLVDETYKSIMFRHTEPPREQQHPGRARSINQSIRYLTTPCDYYQSSNELQPYSRTAHKTVGHTVW